MACFLPYHSLDYCNKGLIHNHVRIMFYFRLLKETISAQISLKSELNIRKPSAKVMANPWAILILWFLQFSMQYVQLQLESAHSCFVILPPGCMPLRHASLLLANLPKHHQKTIKFINSEKATNIWKKTHTFFWHYILSNFNKSVGDFFKFCSLHTISELYLHESIFYFSFLGV